MKRIIWLVLLSLVSYIIYSGYSLWTYGDNENIPNADAAIVLGAAQWNGKPSPVFEGRLKQAIELYNNRKIDHLIFTGGTSTDAVTSEAAVGKAYALDHGVPAENILVENQSLVTEDNLINAKKVSDKKNIDSYLLVSDRFHLKRAVAIAQSKGMEVTGIPTKYSAFESLETKVPFFLREWGYLLGHKVTELFR